MISLQAPTFFKQASIIISGGLLLLISLLISKVLKRIINKERSPKMVEYFTPHDSYAFPSGHATGLASTTVFILFYDLHVGAVAVVLTLTIVIGRLMSHVHDIYDIIAGTLLGALVTYLLFDSVTSYVSTYLLPTFI